jgi:hypothetical protein
LTAAAADLRSLTVASVDDDEETPKSLRRHLGAADAVDGQ